MQNLIKCFVFIFRKSLGIEGEGGILQRERSDRAPCMIFHADENIETPGKKRLFGGQKKGVITIM